MGDDDKITIWTHNERNGTMLDGYVPDFSPFANRVECYLKLHHQPYTKAGVEGDLLSHNP